MTTEPPAVAERDRRRFVTVIGVIVVAAIGAAVVLALNGATSGVEAVGAIGSFALGSLAGQARR